MTCFDVRWKGRPLRSIALGRGEWTFSQRYAERLAARDWHLTPAQWEALPVDERAEMFAVWQTEKLRTGVEQAQNNKPPRKK